MREIKFRAWSEARNKMLTSPNITPVFWPSLRFCEYNPEGKQITLPLMQFTGLTDKNGVDIYEGDIIKAIPSRGDDFRPWVSQVIYNLSRGQYTCDDEGIAYYEAYEIEVIGNIHQNKELLK